MLPYRKLSAPAFLHGMRCSYVKNADCIEGPLHGREPFLREAVTMQMCSFSMSIPFDPLKSPLYLPSLSERRCRCVHNGSTAYRS